MSTSKAYDEANPARVVIEGLADIAGAFLVWLHQAAEAAR
jgi:hypothetical protein